MKYLVSLWFWFAFVVTSPLALLIGVLITLVTWPFDPSRRVLHRFACTWTHGYLKLNPGWDVRVEHRERLPDGPAVLVANHQSMADIVAVMGLRSPFKFVSKASLFSLPIVGWMMRLLRYVRVQRGRPRSMQRMLEDCRRWLRRGEPVLLFPEGTYSPDGNLLPFKRGAFLLAIEEQVPVVPVVIEGTRDLVVEDGPWLNERCRIHVDVLPPIAPDALGTDEEALARRVRDLIADRLFVHRTAAATEARRSAGS